MHITSHNLTLPQEGPIDIPRELLPALRSDHAGETGAVYIYRGIRAVTRDPEIAAFANAHQTAEERHLEIMEKLVPQVQRSRLLPLWRLAGWVTGALPTLLGARAVYRTIDAVESFVDLHYSEQIDQLEGRERYRDLRMILRQCRDDELAHRDEARGRLPPCGTIGRIWTRLVSAGSRIGVFIASRV